MMIKASSSWQKLLVGSPGFSRKDSSTDEDAAE